jgi:small subunit ribosomal protein S20
MANTNAAKKDIRQAKRKATANKVVKDAYKQAVKTVLREIEEGKKVSADTIKAVQKRLDKASKKGIIKKNTAARKLSRLMKKVHKISN